MTVVKLMKIYKFNNKKVLHTNCYPIEYTYSYKSILHYNSLSSLLVDIVLFGFTLLGFPSIGRGFHTLIKDVSLTSPIPPPPRGQHTRWLVPFSNRCGTPPNSSPLEPSVLAGTSLHVHSRASDSASSLAHRPVSGSDTLCNGPSPLRTNIVLFGLFLSGFPSRFLKRVC